MPDRIDYSPAVVFGNGQDERAAELRTTRFSHAGRPTVYRKDNRSDTGYPHVTFPAPAFVIGAEEAG